MSANTNEVAVIKTSAGEMVVEFWADVAPKTVENFKKLSRDGFYDGTAFHRVVKRFVIQGGMMNTRQAPLPEPVEKHVHQLKAEFNDQPHDLGVLSMARQAAEDSASTSFFIVTARAASLDLKYTVFGRVLEGIDVVKAIEGVAVNGEAPVDPVIVTRVRVVTP